LSVSLRFSAPSKNSISDETDTFPGMLLRRLV
jgi:hypothetical protein